MTLKCFICKRPLPTKADVWRDAERLALCEGCFREVLYNDPSMDEDSWDWLISEIRDHYDRNYAKMKADEVIVDCPKCGLGNIYFKRNLKPENEEACHDCRAWIVFDLNGKVLRHYESEDAAIQAEAGQIQ